MKYIPLRVEFHLVEPVTFNAFPRHLDALVAYSVTKSVMDSGVLEDASISVRSIADSLPFAKLEHGDEWVWAASALMPHGFGEKHVRMWRTHMPEFDYAERFCSDQIVRSRAKLPLPHLSFSHIIDTARGLTKNMLERYPVQYINRFEAFCLATSMDEVEDRLSGITAIGARRRVGHGLLAKPAEVFHDERATLMAGLRVTPWRQSDDDVQIQAAVKAPYWSPENRRQAYCHPSILG